MSIKNLAGQTATYGLSTMIVRFINYLLTPYLTGILSTEQYGVINYYYGLIPFGLIILTMGLETGFFRFISKCDNNKDKAELYSTVLTFVSLISIVFLIGVCILTPHIYSYLGDAMQEALGTNRTGSISIIPIVATIIVIDSIQAIQYAKIRSEVRTKLFFKAKIISVVINVLACVFFYSVLPLVKDTTIFGWMWIEDYNEGYIFIANLLASALTAIFLISSLKGVSIRINKKLLHSVFLFSLPLFISGFGGTLNEFIDRQLLIYLNPNKALAFSQLGIYTGVMKVAALMYIFLQMYKYAAEPFFLSNVKKEDFKKNNADALKYFTIASMLIFLIITLYLDIFQLMLSKEEYRVGLDILPVLLVSNILIGVYFNLSFWYKITGRTYFAIVITFIGVAVTLLLNILLIPYFNYEGAAYARLICEGVMVIVCYILNQKYFPVKYDIKSILKYSIATVIIYYTAKFIPIENTILKLAVNTILIFIFILYITQQEKINIRYIIKNCLNK